MVCPWIACKVRVLLSQERIQPRCVSVVCAIGGSFGVFGRLSHIDIDENSCGHGDDLMYGGDGDDQITGGAGDDWLVGGAGDDVLTGYLGNDVVIGGAGADLIKGGDGNDIVDGRSDDTRDYLNGGAGDDILHVGAMDYANGGTGADVFAIDLAADATVDDYDPNSDVIELTYSDQAPDLTTTVDDNGITLHADGQAVVTLLGVKTLDLGAIRLTPLPPVAA